MSNPFFQQHMVSINDWSRADIDTLLTVASQFKVKPAPYLLADKVIASCFFEPSTRTRLSFESAICRLGGKVIGFADPASTSHKKGESLSDTIRMLSSYADALILRHPNAGAARLASEVSDKPVINAGDGGNQHPTQTLLDLFTIQECNGQIDELHIGLVGDLKYGRTVHSLAQACRHFKVRFYFVAPDSLGMPEGVCAQLRQAGVPFTFHQYIEDVLPKVDVLYMTRLQKERFDPTEYEAVKQHFVLTPELVEQGKDSLRILHPLPRVNEIDPGVDALSQAYYFQQAANGIPVRQALLALLLNKDVG